MKLPRVCFIFQLSSEFTVERDFGHEQKRTWFLYGAPSPDQSSRDTKVPSRNFRQASRMYKSYRRYGMYRVLGSASMLADPQGKEC